MFDFFIVLKNIINVMNVVIPNTIDIYEGKFSIILKVVYTS